MPLTRPDFEQILNEFSSFWDTEATRPRHHPMFLEEFGDSAWVIRDPDQPAPTVAAYLLGFLAQTAPYAYVHMVAVRRGYRRRGLAESLYRHFIEFARRSGCSQLKATADPGNHRSIGFHRALGMATIGGTADSAGTVGVVADYGGPGIDRVVFTLEIA